ncbi:MAG: hypothetical protein V1802_01840 [Candidatus Aenigmatarchaeota archaeon]
MKKVKEKKAKWGERMIKLTVQFWTNNLPEGVDNRTAWASGAIHIVAMKSRGIKHDHVFFNNLEEFFPKMQELIDRHNVKLIEPPKKINVVDLRNLKSRT